MSGSESSDQVTGPFATTRGQHPAPDPGPVFPVMLDLRGRRCLVVGDTAIARQRVEALERAGALVVSATAGPEVNDDFESATERPWLVVAATGSATRDASIARRADAAGILANAHDQPAVSSFHMTARLTRGPLEIAVGTGAAVPALAVRVRNLLAELIGDEVVALVDDASRARRRAREEGVSASTLDWDALLAPIMTAIDARIAQRSSR